MENSQFNREFKTNPFKVPKNYFEDFDRKVICRLPEQANTRIVKFNMKHYGIAVGLFLALGIAAFFYFNNTTADSNFEEIAINQAELNDFSENVEFSNDEFNELLSNHAIDSLYQIEIISVSNHENIDKEIENSEEVYSPLDEIEI